VYVLNKKSCDLLGLVSTSVIDDGEAQHIRRGLSLPIRQVFLVELGKFFLVELGPRPWNVIGSSGLRPDGCWLVVIASWT
jgi:hypothetical protein